MSSLSAIEWQQFLSRHDLTWNSIGTAWEQGAFIGNGTLGAMIYKQDANTLRWEIGSTEVVERFQIPRVDWAPPRLLLGDFLLNTIGNIQSASMRLDLWNAEASGQIVTDKGEIVWRSFVHADDKVIFVELDRNEGEANATLEFAAEHGISPCLHYDRIRAIPDADWLEAHQPEKPSRCEFEGITYSSQNYLAGGQYCVGWQTIEEGNFLKLYATVASTYPHRNAIEATKEQLQTCPDSEKAFDQWIQAHQDWWHTYYRKSFVSFSDAYWESVYWIQMYKLGSATRANSPVLDSQGPWLTQTPWPTCVWNLNVQTSYSPLFTSNRFEIAESLFSTLDNNMNDLIMNVPDPFRKDSAGMGRSSSSITLESKTFPGFETGNLTWVCFIYYRHYRCTMDKQVLRDRFYPLLRRAINYYFHLKDEGADGKMHLLYSVSPEYGPDKYTRDCNYDLALFEWGCRTLLDITDRLGVEDERQKDWQDVIERLVETQTDENGIRIGRDLSFEKSHRHFSHLFSIWPLRIRNVDHSEERELIDTSIDHWLSLDEELQGYTWTSSSCMASSFGNGDLALERLNKLRPYLQPNTMYMENGPVIETPISAAESIHDMLLQSWTDPKSDQNMDSTIRVFPAVPEQWKDACFNQLRAEGAFLVSASRTDAKTQWIHIESLEGEPCVIQVDFSETLESLEDVPFERLDDNRWQVSLKKGESVTLYPEGLSPKVEIQAIPFANDHSNLFGMANKDHPLMNGKLAQDPEN